MARASQGSGSQRVEAGWAALGQGRWTDARDAFEEAVAAGETPEAVEGLSWALWWLDDAAAVLAARERAYRLYRQRGDARSAGRMAVWLASDQLEFSGAMAVTSGWLGRAHRLLAPLEPGPDHGWLAFHEGFIAVLCGELEKADELGARAAGLGHELDVPDLEMLGLALRGSTLVARARVDEGMRCLDEATVMALAGEATIPISCAWACCFLVSACTGVRDFERAREWCGRIEEFAARHGSRYMLAFCRAEYGVVYLWQGRWREAGEMLEAAVEDFARSRPLMVEGPLAQLAELRRRQGRAGEAARLLDRAGSSENAQLCRARLALDRGDAPQAIEIAERLVRQMSEHHQLRRIPALEALIRARVAAGELDRAGAALGELREIAGRVGTAPMRASVDRAAGILAAAEGDHADARTLLEDAIDRFDRCGAPYEASIARIELASTLRALGDDGAARRETDAARARLGELGAVAEAGRADRALGAEDGGGRSPGAPVTPREGEVLALLAQGRTNREIGKRLGVSEHTVHRHVTNILRKLDLPSRTAAAAYAVRAGLAGDAGDA